MMLLKMWLRTSIEQSWIIGVLMVASTIMESSRGCVERLINGKIVVYGKTMTIAAMKGNALFCWSKKFERQALLIYRRNFCTG